MRTRVRSLLLALPVSACVDGDALSPPDTSSDPMTVLAEARGGRLDPTAAAGARVLVLFKGAPPATLASYVQALGGSLEFTHPVGIGTVRGLDAGGLAALATAEGVLAVAPDVLYALDDAAQGAPRGAPGSVPVADASNPSGAPFFPAQWHLSIIGAPAAWAAGKLGSPAVTVAILDTGIDYLHPDLVGLVDLGRSTSFVPLDDAVAQINFPGRHPTTDLHYHGTHVAATVASNAVVAAGVTSRTTLMAVRVCTYATNPATCSTVDVLRGILHAVDQGADVINLSLGGGFEKTALGPLTSIIQRVMNYAHQRGVTVVVSAGNSARDMDRDGNLFSAYCDGVHALCVSATAITDEPTSYTNFGRSSVSVAAPGGSPDGAVWAACSTSSAYFPVCAPGNFALGLAGTSMAAPHVAGLAALLVAEVGRNPAQVRGRILKGAVDLGQRGTDPWYGRGRISVPGSLGF